MSSETPMGVAIAAWIPKPWHVSICVGIPDGFLMNLLLWLNIMNQGINEYEVIALNSYESRLFICCHTKPLINNKCLNRVLTEMSS